MADFIGALGPLSSGQRTLRNAISLRLEPHGAINTAQADSEGIRRNRARRIASVTILSISYSERSSKAPVSTQLRVHSTYVVPQRALMERSAGKTRARGESRDALRRPLLFMLTVVEPGPGSSMALHLSAAQ